LLAIAGIIPSLGLADVLHNGKPLTVGVRGEDIGRLKEYSRRLEDALYRVPGIVDLEASLAHQAPEYRLNVDQERAADLGLSNGVIAASVGVLIGGEAVTTFEDEDGEARNVRVRLPADRRLDAPQIEGLRLTVPHLAPWASRPVLVPLANVARYELSTTPSEIRRVDLSREVTVSANLDGLPLGTAVQHVREASRRLDLVPGYRVVISGENEAMDESFGSMGQALVLALVFVYLILAAQFESFVDPLAIMLSLPLSIVGMAGTLLITGDTLSIVSMIGLIMLMGLVTKNAILLVDYAKVLQGRGVGRREALIEAGRTRLRPIVMTTSAMVFGMLPLALALGSGAEMRAPMARAVIGGLITSTLLTLVVVPVVYSLLEDLAVLVARRRHARAEVATAAGSLLLAALLVLGPGASSVMAQGGATKGNGLASSVAQPGVNGGTGVRVVTLEHARTIAAAQNRDVLKAISD
jgi:HAE1 family hydrophobic/amphiphilic exporter-1